MNEDARRARRLARQTDRMALAEELATEYGQGSSIRQVAEGHRLTYGTTRNLLADAGVTFRRRGGRKKTSK